MWEPETVSMKSLSFINIYQPYKKTAPVPSCGWPILALATAGLVFENAVTLLPVVKIWITQSLQMPPGLYGFRFRWGDVWRGTWHTRPLSFSQKNNHYLKSETSRRSNATSCVHVYVYIYIPIHIE